MSLCKLVIVITLITLRAKAQSNSNETTLAEGNIGPFELYDRVWSGEWRQYASQSVDEDGSVFESVDLYFRMGVRSEFLTDGRFVQTYASIQDPETKLYSSFTCNVEFNTDADYAETKVVRSFEGSKPLTVSNFVSGKWNGIAVEDMLEEEEDWSLIFNNEQTDY